MRSLRFKWLFVSGGFFFAHTAVESNIHQNSHQRFLPLRLQGQNRSKLFADFLNAMGRPDEAIAERRRNQERDPLSFEAVGGLAAELYWAHRYDETIEVTRKVLAVDPNLWSGRLYLGLALAQNISFPKRLPSCRRRSKLPTTPCGSPL